MDPSPTFIRNRRAELGLRQFDLARRAGVTDALVGHWETGERPLSADRRPKVERALALGERRKGDLVFYVLGRARAGEPFDPYLDNLLRPGVLGDHNLATKLAEVLRAAGEPDATAAPAWSGYVGTLVATLRKPGEDPADLAAHVLDTQRRADGSRRAPHEIAAGALRFAAEAVEREVVPA